MKGRLITFEGINGCGKSTYAEMAAERLSTKQHKAEYNGVVVTKEPGASTSGAVIRKLLFSDPTANFGSGYVDALFMANHIQHVHEIVRPAVLGGKLVLSDRYADSHFAFRVVRKDSNDTVCGAFRSMYGLMPDLTILITGSPTVLCQRALAVRDKIKRVPEPWLNAQDLGKVQLAYVSNIGNSPRTKTIEIRNGESKDEVFEKVWFEITKKLTLWRDQDVNLTRARAAAVTAPMNVRAS